MSGCEVVFHVAADYRLWVRDPAEMYRSNVEGTRAILEAARQEKKFAASCIPPASPPWASPATAVPLTKDSPVSLADMIGHYKRSKFMAEQIALEAAATACAS